VDSHVEKKKDVEEVEGVRSTRSNHRRRWRLAGMAMRGARSHQVGGCAVFVFLSLLGSSGEGTQNRNETIWARGV